MERYINVSSEINSTSKLESGAVVSVQQKIEQRPIPSDVAHHEAAHIIAARKIKSATIIPSGNALGTTVPEKMTAAAAAAAAALGHEGTSWDMMIVERYLGVDPESAKAAARTELKGQEEEMHEVATILEEKKTIGQKDVDVARQNVVDRRNGIHMVEVSITKPEGGTLRYISQSINNKVDIELEESPLPLAA